jgi:hypothetical protein
LANRWTCEENEVFEVGLFKILILPKGLEETHNYNCTFFIHTLVKAFEGKKNKRGKNYC